MNNQTCKTVGQPPAYPKKVTELFFVTNPKAPKASLASLLTNADAECGRVVMRSTDVVVTACLANSLDELERLTQQLENLAKRFTPPNGAA